MRRFPKLAVVAAFAVAATLVPLPALSLTAPETVAEATPLGTLDGAGPEIDPGFPIDFVGVSWTAGDEPAVRFRIAGEWTGWRTAHEDGLPAMAGRISSGLLDGGDADAYQVRATAEGLRAIAINTTDGPRSLAWATPEAGASHLGQPPVVSRPGWGAEESYRFKSNGDLKSTPTFFPTQKLIVHHTATSNTAPDPAATVRAIYYDHVMNRGFADIAYNFLIDPQGRIYKGRYSGKPGTRTADTLTGENAKGKGVTGAHTGGYNSGTMGVSLLGNFTSVSPTPQMRQALIDHLAWEADRHGLDALASSTYRNPDSGATKHAPNVTGHRDWGSTECPGGTFYADLPNIRHEVAAKAGRADARPPRIKRVTTEKVRRRVAVLRWETNEPATAQVRYRPKGKGWRASPVKAKTAQRHRVRLGGLKRDRKYSYRVVSADRSGNVTRSKRFTFTTAA